MGFVTRSAPAYGGVRRFVKVVLGGWPAPSPSDSVCGGRHVIRRVLPYLAAIAAVGVVSLGLAGLAWVLGIARVETFLLIFVLLVGAIAWRLGRGPAIAATAAVALVTDYFFLPPVAGFGVGSVSDVVRLVTGILAAAAVIQFVHVARRRESLLRRRK